MKITYNAEMDVLRIIFSDNPIEESEETQSGLIVDYDLIGNLVGLEILDAAKRDLKPLGVDYSITGIAAAS